MTLNDPYPSFNVTPFFDAEYLINSTTYRYSFNEILIGTYTRLILSDLAKYSMTWSVALPLCDSWASSFKMLRRKNCLVRCSWRAWRLTIPAKSDSHRVWKLFARPASVMTLMPRAGRRSDSSAGPEKHTRALDAPLLCRNTCSKSPIDTPQRVQSLDETLDDIASTCWAHLRLLESWTSFSFLSRRSRQRERLNASMLSICSSVSLFVCLSVCRQNAKKRDFFKK